MSEGAEPLTGSRSRSLLRPRCSNRRSARRPTMLSPGRGKTTLARVAESQKLKRASQSGSPGLHVPICTGVTVGEIEQGRGDGKPRSGKAGAPHLIPRHRAEAGRVPLQSNGAADDGRAQGTRRGVSNRRGGLEIEFPAQVKPGAEVEPGAQVESRSEIEPGTEVESGTEVEPPNRDRAPNRGPGRSQVRRIAQTCYAGYPPGVGRARPNPRSRP